MKKFVITYFLSLLAFIAIDNLWIQIIAGPMYSKEIPDMLLMEQGALSIRMSGVLFFYLLYPIGVMYFSKLAKSTKESFIHGAVLGIFSYGTFALTNHAVLKNFPLTLVIPDMIWGAIITSSLSYIIYKLLKKLS